MTESLSGQSGSVAEKIQESLRSLTELADGPRENKASRGPRKLPKPDARKKARRAARESRRRNR